MRGAPVRHAPPTVPGPRAPAAPPRLTVPTTPLPKAPFVPLRAFARAMGQRATRFVRGAPLETAFAPLVGRILQRPALKRLRRDLRGSGARSAELFALEVHFFFARGNTVLGRANTQWTFRKGRVRLHQFFTAPVHRPRRPKEPWGQEARSFPGPFRYVLAAGRLLDPLLRSARCLQLPVLKPSEVAGILPAPTAARMARATHKYLTRGCPGLAQLKTDALLLRLHSMAFVVLNGAHRPVGVIMGELELGADPRARWFTLSGYRGGVSPGAG